MQATADSLAFAPPREPAAVRGFLLAAIAHILLIVALTWGITWDKDTTPPAVEAELWSALPQEAAPPPPPPAPAPTPPQPAVQAPPVQAAPAPAPPPPVVEKAPDINVEREKKRKQEEARREQEEERRKLLEAQKKKQAEDQKRRAEEQAKLAKERADKAEKAAKEKAAKEQLAKEQAAKEKARQELDAKKREQLRKEQLARMQALAAGSGSPTSQGVAAKSSGPSDSWSGRIQRAVYPNIIFTQTATTKLRVGIEIRLAPDGTVVGEPVVREPSGNPAWDDAVVRGIKKTGILPRDVDGRVFSPALIGFTREPR